MILAPAFRKLLLTAHVVTSVGWIGAVTCFLVLAIAGLVDPDIQVTRATYIAMDFAYRWAVIPLGLASLASGVMSSVGTDWGLLSYYWVLVKLLITVPAVLLMLIHVGPVRYAAQTASEVSFVGTDLTGLRYQLLLYAGAALVLLLTATVLSIYKPRGRTRYGTRKLTGQRAS